MTVASADVWVASREARPHARVVGPNEIVERLDVNHLLDRADPDRLLARVDVDAVMDRIDAERLVQRAGIPDIVAESTGSVAESALDLMRRQLLGLDVVMTRGAMRVLGRDDASLPAGPTTLAGDGGPSHSLPVPYAPVNDVTGHYAGAVTRWPPTRSIPRSQARCSRWRAERCCRPCARSAYRSRTSTAPVCCSSVRWRCGCSSTGWASTAVAGRTPGMAIVGLRIVSRMGDPLWGRRAFLRVLTLPLSLVLTGLGLLGIVFDRECRALHDVIAGSTVVYDWGDRMATMPTPLARWLAQHAAPIDPGAEATR